MQLRRCGFARLAVEPFGHKIAMLVIDGTLLSAAQSLPAGEEEVSQVSYLVVGLGFASVGFRGIQQSVEQVRSHAHS